MKVKQITRSQSALENSDYQDKVQIEIDGKLVFQVHDGEPEDNDLSRNFSDVYEIGELLKLAYQAGKQGKSFELEIVESDEV